MPATAPDAVASLWNFAVSLHALPGLEAAMLPLQDEAHLDIPELLWMCWLERRDEHAIDMNGEEPLEPIRNFRRRYTEPLRSMRRELKPWVAHTPRLAAMRKAIKQAELESERESLHRLAQLERKPGAPSEDAWQQWHGQLSSHYRELIQQIRHHIDQISLE